MDIKQKMMEAQGATEADFKPKDINNKLQALMDIVSIDRVTSDKLGYDWEVIKVGDMEVKKTYVANPNAKGTADNPFTDKSILIDNAYYMIDGTRYVYIGGQFVEF